MKGKNMENFTYYNPARILFGRNTEAQVGREMKRLGSRVLLVYGGGSIKRSGLYDTVVRSLTDEGLSYVELPGVKPNPRLALVREGIRLCREHQVDAILAVGGGSTIDTAKAVAFGVPYEGDVWDFFEGKAEIRDALPIGVVLTIPAAGSESSDSCVITKEEGLLKRSAASERMIPRFAILNPAFTCTLPAYQTACGATDILAHLMERYFTQTAHVDFTDRLLEAAMRTIINYTPMALEHPDNYDIRAELMWAGTVAHNNLLDTGRIADWASHGIEHELSALYDIAHGAGLAMVFPAWMKYVCHAGMSRFVQFAVRVFDVDLAFGEPEQIVAQGIRRLEAYLQSIGLPIRLSEAGIDDSRFREMAEKATRSGPAGHFQELYAQDVENIYRLAL